MDPGDDEGAAEEAASGEAVERVEALIVSMGRRISDASPHRPALAESLAALSRLGTDRSADDLIPYARLAISRRHSSLTTGSNSTLCTTARSARAIWPWIPSSWAKSRSG
ncbi:hypothetical protein [Streptomyces justiciae]|uniref:Uncharacterized protein n=1 Tax=Streptomyces justiciae TaxID=2780140 RepID=A0ABU3LSC7_9ACTN|nr:hypothetical protein [Streptomyces justiciae]MDT7842095.1 hypothetical protein [Streptomyces justiciae]